MYTDQQGNQRPTGEQHHRASAATRVQPISAPLLSFDEIRGCTDDFGPQALIGEGSYGRVYYATLQERVAAIKKLDASCQPDLEFLSQVWFDCGWHLDISCEHESMLFFRG